MTTIEKLETDWIDKVKTGVKFTLAFILVPVYIFGVAETAKWLHQQPFFAGLRDYPFLHNITTMVILAIITQVLLFLILTFQSKWRKPSIFLSHKGELFDKASIIRQQLEAQDFRVYLLPFSTNYTHDHVVKWVRDHIRASDAMVVIPDAQKASFVDAEILAASVKGIPIVVMQHSASHVQPSTLLRGFPIFDFEKVEADQSLALRDYLLFSIQHRRDLWRNFRRHFNWELYAFGIFGLLFIGLINSIFNPIYEFVISLIFSNYQTENSASDPVMAGAFAAMFIIAMLVLFFSHRKNLGISRQHSITGIKSFDEFEEAFTIPSDKRILDFLNKNEFRPLGSD